MIRRHITDSIYEALKDSPVILLNGARQTGKSTLVKNLSTTDYSPQYMTFDNAAVLSAATSDPEGFINSFNGPVIIDEIQRAPELFVAIKSAVDERRDAGRFLLTGSADVLLLPNLLESLTGRMEIFTLWPFSRGEITGKKETFIDDLFKTEFSIYNKGMKKNSDIMDSVLLGSYPEILVRKQRSRRDAWFNSYTTTILQRDVRDIANIEGLSELPRLFQLLSSRSTGLLNYTEISRSSGIPLQTLKRYFTLFEMTFLIQTLPAWSGNLGKQTIKSPKLYLNDSGLMAYLQGIDKKRLRIQPQLKGPLVENFVIMEIRKQITWSNLKPKMFHFRSQTGYEVDIVLEDRTGELVGVEVKSSSTVTNKDFKGLKKLHELTGKKFNRGVVLYMGKEYVPFGNNLYAVPMNALWTEGAKKK